MVGPVRNSEKMRWDFIPPLTDIDVNHTVGVDGVALVRVDDNTEQARIGLGVAYTSYAMLICIQVTYIDELGNVSGLQIPQNRSLVEIGHVGHIVKLLHLGRVDLVGADSYNNVESDLHKPACTGQT